MARCKKLIINSFIKIYYYLMVLLSNNNQLDIKKYHILQCLQKKKESFNIFVVPLNKTLDKNDTDNKPQVEFKNVNISDKDIDSIFGSSNNK